MNMLLLVIKLIQFSQQRSFTKLHKIIDESPNNSEVIELCNKTTKNLRSIVDSTIDVELLSRIYCLDDGNSIIIPEEYLCSMFPNREEVLVGCDITKDDLKCFNKQFIPNSSNLKLLFETFGYAII